MTDGDALPLTARELEVLHWAMLGKTAGETADILGIRTRTVTFHIGNILQRLGCTSKHQAVLKAVELGLLHVGRGQEGPQQPRGGV